MKALAILFAGLALGILLLSPVGCAASTPRGAAIAAVNASAEVAEAAHAAITATCAPLYESAATRADLAAADGRCLRPIAAYEAFAAVWVSARAAVAADTSNPAEALTLAQELVRRGRELRTAAEALRGAP